MLIFRNGKHLMFHKEILRNVCEEVHVTMSQKGLDIYALVRSNNVVNSWIHE